MNAGEHESTTAREGAGVRVTYRVAVVADAPVLSEVAARLFLESYAHVMEPELEGYARDSFTPERQHAELIDRHCTTFLANADRLIGYAQVVEDSLPACAIDARKPAELKRIYVHHTYHGRGVAQDLLKLVQQEAQRRACDCLWLAVWEINERAISFYSKNGFQMIGRQGFPIGSDDLSDHVMAKPLANELR